MLTDAGGVPIVAKTTAANRHDVTELLNLVNDVPAIKGKPGTPRYRFDELYADRAYYDSNGNTQHSPQPKSLGSAYTGIYDALNRLVEVKAGSDTVATFAYDGRNVTKNQVLNQSMKSFARSK